MRPTRQLVPLAAHQQGAALILVLLVSIVALGAALLAARGAKTSFRIAHNELLGRQALAVAEAGISHAFAIVNADLADGLSDELTGNGSLVSMGDLVTVEDKAYRKVVFGSDSSYLVRAEDNFDEIVGRNNPATDTDGRIYLRSLGRVDNAQRIIEISVRRTVGPDCAILTEQNLDISGNPCLTGEKACAHSNHDMDVSGNPDIEQGAFAAATMNISGKPTLEHMSLDTQAVRDQLSG